MTEVNKLKFVPIPIEFVNSSVGVPAWEKYGFDVYNGKFTGRLNVYRGIDDNASTDWVFAICSSNDAGGKITNIVRSPAPDIKDKDQLIETVKTLAEKFYKERKDKPIYEGDKPVRPVIPTNKAHEYIEEHRKAA